MKHEASRSGRDARSTELARQMAGYRLATAHILYHMPDHPDLLQSFIWQQYDLAPDYPELRKFLDFWTDNLDGKLHTVEVAGRRLIAAASARSIAEFRVQ